MKKNADRPAARADAKLPFRVKAGFGIGDLGGNLFFTAMGSYSLIFLTDTVGLPAALAGAALLIGKIWDAVVDPFIGFYSDRTRSRWGRRRPWLLLGALPLLLTMWLFFSTPDFRNSPALGCVWATFALCLLNTAYSAVNIPYGALTPELTKDYTERTSLNGFRFGFAVVGTILGAAAVQPIVDFVGEPHRGFSVVGLIFGVIMAATILATFFAVREPGHGGAPMKKQEFLPTFFGVLTDRVYLRLACVYMLNLIGITFVQSMIVYYFKYFYREDVSIALLILLGVAMLCVPLSVLVSRRVGKKRTYQLALLILAAACMAIFFLGHILGKNFTLLMMAFAGIGIGFGYVPPFAMLPDVVEADAVRTKTRKEGAYYGMWTFCAQLGVALAAAASGALLDVAKYITPESAEQFVAQPDSAMFMIRLLMGPISAAIFLSGILLIHRYPIDERTYEAIIAEGENAGAGA